MSAEIKESPQLETGRFYQFLFGNKPVVVLSNVYEKDVEYIYHETKHKMSLKIFTKNFSLYKPQ